MVEIAYGCLQPEYLHNLVPVNHGAHVTRESEVEVLQVPLSPTGSVCEGDLPV